MILETKAPLKERYVRNNEATFLNKNLQNAIMNPYRLLNRYRKEKTKATRCACTGQRNSCMKLLREAKEGPLQ